MVIISLGIPKLLLKRLMTYRSLYFKTPTLRRHEMLLVQCNSKCRCLTYNGVIKPAWVYAIEICDCAKLFHLKSILAFHSGITSAPFHRRQTSPLRSHSITFFYSIPTNSLLEISFQPSLDIMVPILTPMPSTQFTILTLPKEHSIKIMFHYK